MARAKCPIRDGIPRGSAAIASPTEVALDPERIRYLDKLVDELAKGRAMDKVLRR